MFFLENSSDRDEKKVNIKIKGFIQPFQALELKIRWEKYTTDILI